MVHHAPLVVAEVVHRAPLVVEAVEVRHAPLAVAEVVHHAPLVVEAVEVRRAPLAVAVDRAPLAAEEVYRTHLAAESEEAKLKEE